MGEVEADRAAKTVADLATRFKEQHLPKKRPSTARLYSALIDREILPSLRATKVGDVTFAQVDEIHRRMTTRGAVYQANRAVAVLSKMFNLAIRWQWRSDNPARGVERNPEVRRRRYLSPDELRRLTKELARHGDEQAANIIRLLLLTGARRSEVQSMRWTDVDLNAGIWTKPGATTKQKTEHRVPLSAPARKLLTEIHKQAANGAEFVFPGRFGDAHRAEIKSDWAAICKKAKIAGVRLHDLRHTYASILASAGLSLPVIGALLGHTQPATTARYAHLFDDPLRAATERVGAIIAGAVTEAEVVPIKRRS
jgi:integrase